ncbi:hypothetical protein BJ875DRAFT_479012 [Amylocarpus encephaloides]|uniref:Uncharacterized protein n=1 Tax=Amylocarpus encephaloides TaxID=45428 RepID=A0A9P7Y765_9HELO|nr:hypothetical protein BJ875DRAFT_479012 [Amylocarpus encephaloides]
MVYSLTFSKAPGRLPSEDEGNHLNQTPFTMPGGTVGRYSSEEVATNDSAQNPIVFMTSSSAYSSSGVQDKTTPYGQVQELDTPFSSIMLSLPRPRAQLDTFENGRRGTSREVTTSNNAGKQTSDAPLLRNMAIPESEMLPVPNISLIVEATVSAIKQQPFGSWPFDVFLNHVTNGRAHLLTRLQASYLVAIQSEEGSERGCLGEDLEYL